MFFTYLSVSISSLVKLPAIETIFFSFFDLLSKSSRRVPGTLFFTHDHESVKCKSVFSGFFRQIRRSAKIRDLKHRQRNARRRRSQPKEDWVEGFVLGGKKES